MVLPWFYLLFASNPLEFQLFGGFRGHLRQSLSWTGRCEAVSTPRRSPSPRGPYLRTAQRAVARTEPTGAVPLSERARQASRGAKRPPKAASRKSEELGVEPLQAGGWSA